MRYFQQIRRFAGSIAVGATMLAAFTLQAQSGDEPTGAVTAAYTPSEYARPSQSDVKDPSRLMAWRLKTMYEGRLDPSEMMVVATQFGEYKGRIDEQLRSEGNDRRRDYLADMSEWYEDCIRLITRIVAAHAAIEDAAFGNAAAAAAIRAENEPKIRDDQKELRKVLDSKPQR